MTQMFPFILIIVIIMSFLGGYWLGTKDSFAINCYNKGLIPMITPDKYRVCWNNTLKFDDTRFKLDLEIGGYEYVK